MESYPPFIISPAEILLILDNTVVSTLHKAGELRRVLHFWPDRWLLPLQVKDEAAAWPIEGPQVTGTLGHLCDQHVIHLVALDPHLEGQLFARLSRTLGQGEAAAITIAYHRRYGVALDDYQARRACDRLVPPVLWIATEGLLQCAVAEGHLAPEEARAMWKATGIPDPKRQVL